MANKRKFDVNETLADGLAFDKSYKKLLLHVQTVLFNTLLELVATNQETYTGLALKMNIAMNTMMVAKRHMAEGKQISEALLIRIFFYFIGKYGTDWIAKDLDEILKSDIL